MGNTPVKVLCVDDNPLVTEPLKVRLDMAGFLWAGSLPSADTLTKAALDLGPDIVLLDIDMPGRDPFDALAELTRLYPKSRVIIYTGHVRFELLDRAFEAGAWGYVAKSADATTLIDAIQRVAGGDVVIDTSLAYVRPEPGPDGRQSTARA